MAVIGESICIQHNGAQIRAPTPVYAAVYLSNNRRVCSGDGYMFFKISPVQTDDVKFVFIVAGTGASDQLKLNVPVAVETEWQYLKCPGWYSVATDGSLSPTQAPGEKRSADDAISGEIRNRAQSLADDTEQAENNVNFYKTLDGYTTIRVKRAFAMLNHKGILDKLCIVQEKVAGLEKLASSKPQFAASFVVPTEPIATDIYFPCTEDYNL